MAEKMTYINPNMLSWARVESGTSLDDAISKFGDANIAAWEKGDDFPTYSQLKDLCYLYRKPVAIFFFPEPPILKSITASCRTLPSNMELLFSRNIVKLLDEARVMQLNLYELYDNKNPRIYKIKEEFDCFDIKSVARKLRIILDVSLENQKKVKRYDNAFEVWRDSFYRVGIYVFKAAFKDERISGLCLYDSEFPIIYVNNSFSLSRQIFTLFHEMYHLLHKTSGLDLYKDPKSAVYYSTSDEIIEINCNKFAGEFLVPDEDFESNINSRFFSESLVEKLASNYCVSREVILRKFLDKNLITNDEYSELREIYLKDYFRFIKTKTDNKKTSGNYYNTQMAYLGDRYLRLTFGSYYQKKISIIQLSKYLNMKIPSLKTIASMKGWGSL